ncbi:MAG TPA: M20/M25/M40 family metallo-hydrolase [Firmicutes bacterium]|nr:M20/M25/M40 family metallo-hydrolase [Candidatus Fermentithermobacillaceae bacterium]
MSTQKAEAKFIDDNFETFVLQLQEAVRKPSIAAQNVGMNEAAQHFKRLMETHGISARLIPTRGGYPCVYGEVKGESDRTVLFYNHYDVQPPDPLDEWESGPFSGDIRDGKIYARGVSDNKGNACARIQAVGTMLKLRKQLPITVKFLIEGEEEIGSPHLGEFIRDNAGLLEADYGVWESGYMNPSGRPGMYLGVKGMLYVELIARGASRDMHSGSATTIPNPAWRLVWALSAIKDENEQILIPGFYDDVLSPTDKEMELLRDAIGDKQMNDSEAHNIARENARALGLKSYLLDLYGLDLRKRSLFSPTANICGFSAGYLGKGQKTVLPARALVKMDFRLVPDQDPEDILSKLRNHLDSQGFGDIEVRLISLDYPVKTPADLPVVDAATEAVISVYGRPPVISPTQGGSGPMYPFKKYLGLPMVSFGVGYWGSSNHGPNENIRLEDYRAGIKMAVEFIDKLAETG